MSILLFGSGGQLGAAVRWRALASGRSVVGLSHQDVDIFDMDDIATALVMQKPEVVINCAAYTNVDQAEREPARAFEVNEIGVGNLAAASAEAGLPLITISTDYVFSGARDAAYAETDATGPINAYGRSKLAGEHKVALLNPHHIIVRTSWLFGEMGSNFVKTMLRLGVEQADGIINVVDDQIGGPTPTVALADALLAISARLVADRRFDDWGIYHFAGRPALSWYAFAEVVLAGRTTAALHPVATAVMPRAARRPASSRLSCARMQTVFGIEQPDWREPLAALLRKLDAGI